MKYINILFYFIPKEVDIPYPIIIIMSTTDVKMYY